MRYTIIILAFLLAGCATQKRCNQKWPPQETITETIVYRDTIVYVNIPGEVVNDTLVIESPVDLNTPIKILRTEFCLTRAWIEMSVLRLELEQLPIEKEIIFKDVIVEKEVVKEVVKEVNVLTKWQELRLKFATIAFFILVGFGLFLFVSKR